MTPLMLAIKQEHKNLAKYLVTEARADVNIVAMKAWLLYYNVHHIHVYVLVVHCWLVAFILAWYSNITCSMLSGLQSFLPSETRMRKQLICS